MILSVSLVLLISYFSKNKDLIFTLLFLISIRKAEIKKIIKVAVQVYFIAFLIVIDLSLLNVLPDWLYFRSNEVRHSLGFFYSTIAIGTYLAILLMYFYIRKTKASLIELMVLETLNVFLYVYTDGRLGFILGTIIILVMALTKIKMLRRFIKEKLNCKLLKYFIYSTPICICILTYIMIYLYSQNNSFAIKINELLSDRLLYSYKALVNYGIPMFGKYVKWNGWGGLGYVNNTNIGSFVYNYVDISFIRILIDQGSVFTILIIACYTLIIIKYYKEKDYWMVCAIILVFIWSTIEPFIFNISKNIFVSTFVYILNQGELKFLDYNNLKLKIRNNQYEKKSN